MRQQAITSQFLGSAGMAMYTLILLMLITSEIFSIDSCMPQEEPGVCARCNSGMVD